MEIRAHGQAGVTGDSLLVLGIGNILLGDEGVGVRALEQIERAGLPAACSVLDGGTGGLTLLEPMQRAQKLIIIDATIDGRPAGSIRRLQPRFSADYPVTLTAHDIGLQDLPDGCYVPGPPARVSPYAVSGSGSSTRKVRAISLYLPEAYDWDNCSAFSGLMRVAKTGMPCSSS